MSERLFFFNVHVPKCGGKSFRALLQRNFGARYSEVYNDIIWQQPYPRAQLAEVVADSPGHDCLSSHWLSLDLPFEDARFRAVALTFVRDPVARFFSHYHYLRGRDTESVRYGNLATMNPDEYADYVIATPYEHFLFDYQFEFLVKNAADPTLAGVERLAAGRRLVLMPLERCDECLIVLRRLFPRHFRDVRYAIENVSAKAQHPSPAAIERVRPHMNRDDELHRLANRQLDELLAELFADRAEIERELASARRRSRRMVLLGARPRAFVAAVRRRAARLLGLGRTTSSPGA